MNAAVRRRLERAARVRDFLRAHKTEGTGEGTALARLEELLQRADVLAAQQQAGVVATRSATLQREKLRRGLQTEILKYLVAVGAIAAKENTALLAQFKLPSTSVSNQAFITTARRMLAQANAQKELLVSQGMSATLLDDLTAALGELEKTLEATRAGRRDHVGASADLQAVTKEIAEQVQVLDGLVRYRFKGNAELMAAWASVRNVVGPFKSQAEPGQGETPAGSGPDVVKPAA